MAAAVTGWVTAAVLVLGGTAVAAAAATPDPAWSVSSAPGEAAVSVSAAAAVSAPGPVAVSAPGPVAVTAPGPAAVSAPGAAAVSVPARERVPPVSGEPVRRFEPPPHDYGPGHRGVDLPALAGTAVVSPADGVVTFAGPVAGRGVVVVEHAGSTLTSLEPVTGAVPVGSPVGAGMPVAVVQDAPRHAGCPTGAGSACLHWGVRVEGRYVDPWWWLGRSGPARLLPLLGDL